MEDPELVHAYGLARCWAIGTGIMVERETPKEATEQLTPLKFLLLKMFFTYCPSQEDALSCPDPFCSAC